MTTPFIAIEPIRKSVMFIQWLVGTRCQFDCSYCPDFWHDKTSKDSSMSLLKAAWQKIVDSNNHRPEVKFIVSFTGGEPTINKNFKPFVKWLREEHATRILSIGTATNVTKSIEYYEELVHYLDWCIFSTHSEFTNEKKFFKTIEHIHNYINDNKLTCALYANIMDEPWHAERNKKYIEYLTQRGIKYKLIPLTDFEENKSTRSIRMINKENFDV